MFLSMLVWYLKMALSSKASANRALNAIEPMITLSFTAMTASRVKNAFGNGGIAWRNGLRYFSRLSLRIGVPWNN